jgi:methyl coenzyme M reductase subunit C-like uncharacterized protein (methanogenesis marker protein 7)
MAKILEFRRVAQPVNKPEQRKFVADDTEDDINAIMNDYSLTPANRRWILENMLMDIDDQLEEYKKELIKAEIKLDTVVQAAEKEISTAYKEFNAHVGGMTRAVRRLTRNSQSQTVSNDSADCEAESPDQQITPQ